MSFKDIVRKTDISFFMALEQQLLSIYGQYMHLKLFVDVDEDTSLRDKYIAAANQHHNKLINNLHHIDAGFDLYAPRDSDILSKIDYMVIASARMIKSNGISYNTSYYMYPRSSISKTRMRLANNVGIIDAGYRGHLIGVFDVCESKDNNNHGICQFDRHLQICAPGLVPIVVEIVGSRQALGEQTARGEGGFGSTGI